MGECIITRKSGGLNQETLDLLEEIKLRDPNYATVLCTLRDPEGSPVANEKINVIQSDGTNVQYTTNEIGQIIYKTISPQLIFNDTYSMNYFDQKRASNKTVDTVVGQVYKIDMNRTKKFNNGQNIKISGPNSGTIRFSNLSSHIGYIEVVGGGGTSTGQPINNICIDYYMDKIGNFMREVTSSQNTAAINIGTSGNPGRGGSGYINTANNLNVYNRNISYSIPAPTNKADVKYIFEEKSNYNGFHSFYIKNGRTGFSNAVYELGNNLKGFACGASYFDSISAAGGGGGIVNNTNIWGGGGASGGVKSTVSIGMSAEMVYKNNGKLKNNIVYNNCGLKLSKDNIPSSGSNSINIIAYREYYIHFMLNVVTRSGNVGWIWLNNFQYK